MAKRTYSRLYGPALLSNSAATVLTAATGMDTMLRHIHVKNTSGSAATFTLSIGTDAAGTRLFDALTVPARKSFEWYGETSLDEGEIVQAYSGTNNVLNLTINGVTKTVGAVVSSSEQWETIFSADVTVSGSHVRATFPDGMAAGTAPMDMWKSFTGERRIRIRVVGFRVSASPAYGPHSAGNVKIGFAWDSDPDPSFVPQTYGEYGTFGDLRETGELRLGYSLQGTVSYPSNHFGNGSGPLITRGVECSEIIWDICQNTTGNFDGHVRMYYGGSLVISTESIKWHETGRLFDIVYWAPVFGGAGEPDVGANDAPQPYVTPGFYEEWREWHVERPVA
jgi:hypothetical protein